MFDVHTERTPAIASSGRDPIATLHLQIHSAVKAQSSTQWVNLQSKVDSQCNCLPSQFHQLFDCNFTLLWHLPWCADTLSARHTGTCRCITTPIGNNYANMGICVSHSHEACVSIMHRLCTALTHLRSCNHENVAVSKRESWFWSSHPHTSSHTRHTHACRCIPTQLENNYAIMGNCVSHSHEACVSMMHRTWIVISAARSWHH